jgi:hypothetical protein
MVEKIPFSLLGFELLEPMAFVTNGLVALVCVYGFVNAKAFDLHKWKYFFFFFALGSFSGALSHLFWNYWGFYGKITPWFFGVVSSGFLIAAMVDLFAFRKSTRLIFHIFILLKGTFVLIFAYTFWNFLFVAIDTILSLFVACGVGTFILYFHYDRKDLINLLIGFLIILPSAAVFLLKLDLSLWMNREDISHILIAGGLFFFARSLKNIASREQSYGELNPIEKPSKSPHFTVVPES